MKRGFLFGLGSFLVFGVLAGLLEAFKGDYLFAPILITLCAPLSILAIRKATAAAPNKSRLHAIGGWLIGFCILIVVLLAAANIWVVAN